MTIAPPHPASTVVLARRSPGGFEVFLVRRRDTIAFMGGAHVFPGGAVDPQDRLTRVERWCDGVSHAVGRVRSAEPADAVAYHVAAVRELFEEAGVLLARQEGGQHLVAIQGDASARFEEYRRRLISGELTLLEIASRERVRLALDRLMLFVNWVTPEIETRRFDTWFFLALAPESQDASHHDHEATDGIWIAPADATDRCLRGELALPPPTWTTLRALAQCSSAEGAWARAGSQPVARVQPRVNELPDGTRQILLPGDAHYPPIAGFDARETRFVLKDGRWSAVVGPQAAGP